LVQAWREHDSSVCQYLRWFWQSKTFRTTSRQLSPSDRPLVALLFSWTVVQIAAGVSLFVTWQLQRTPGYLELAAATLLSYPIVTAHMLALVVAGGRVLTYVTRPKQLGRYVVARVLEAQVRQLRRRHHVTVVAVAGSVGKTTTKLAVAHLLGEYSRVRYQSGNYNDRVTVPLVFFGQTEPSLYNPFAWMRVFGENAAALHQPYPYDVVVVELGTDAPGQMKDFAYVCPDITVVTAVTPEHMANFGTLDAVAAEELSVFDYSKRVLINTDMVPSTYLTSKRFTQYSLKTHDPQGYAARATKPSLHGQTLQVKTPKGSLTATVKYLGVQGASSALAAAAVADMLGMDHKALQYALGQLAPFAGRMQVLDGVKSTTLIDDTYNATPVAVQAALDVLYATTAPQRIAILGSMNELGTFAREAHETVGAYCDPQRLDLVVTIGADAKRWLAPAARAAGCQVYSCSTPYQAGRYVAKRLKPQAVVLAKGSQNGVYAEEALKPLLAHPRDVSKLVRQSRAWAKIKANQFAGQGC
jgi:UDP-N-acetylmuramyl pentapeptide synthase